ncbi:hypothetical protein MPER_13102 [Moniliophthora perniciosa FA553]|nr:hypothetical protein MPER_13102 [Moniliophthora perniciosa FA553]
MAPLQTHLTNLQHACSLYSSAPAFKIPIFDDGNTISGYHAVTFAEFNQDVEKYARHWSRRLLNDGIKPRSVVGLCLKGLAYTDVLHIYGLGRAGYVAQCFSLFPSAIQVVASLLKKSNAKALIYQDGYFNASALSTTDVSTTLNTYPSMQKIPQEAEEVDLPVLKDNHAEDIVIMFHSTGSTSGTPKFAPISFKQMDALIAKAAFTCVPSDPKRAGREFLDRERLSWGTVWLNVYYGTCTIQQTSATPSPAEVKAMVKLGALNRACMFPALVSRLLKEARYDSELLDVLASLDSIIHGGAFVPKDDEDWAREKGVNLVNIYGCTELGIPVLLSKGLQVAHPDYLLPIPATRHDGTPLLSYRFEAVPGDADSVDLKRLVVLPGSGDIPDRSLCQDNGRYDTGDLFEEAERGKFIYRGRNDDWIKMANACKCDAASIEADVRKTCGNLIAECIVVGTGRTSPALIVEAANGGFDAGLREEIYQQIAASDAHSTRLPHEKIASADRVLVVPLNSLMRTATKGNVRRRATEEALKEQLDALYV